MSQELISLAGILFVGIVVLMIFLLKYRSERVLSQRSGLFRSSCLVVWKWRFGFLWATSLLTNIEFDNSSVLIAEPFVRRIRYADISEVARVFRFIGYCIRIDFADDGRNRRVFLFCGQSARAYDLLQSRISARTEVR